jgi:phosphatidylinositol 4-kinase
LESLLFDFDTGWGGGSVTVGQFLSPSNHQIDLLKDSMERLQSYRLADEQYRLSRSHRLYKLQFNRQELTIAPEFLAQEALRIAKNADYLSSHLAFTKRLCDVAERLRFLPVEERAGTLQTELSKLNASGTMGGDPLNRIKKRDHDHTRVVRIPITEGHVFRSKERTPVLLLVETMDEGAEEDQSLGLESSGEETEVELTVVEPPSRKEAEQEEKKEINSSESIEAVEPPEDTDPATDNDSEVAPEGDNPENGDDSASQEDAESQSMSQEEKMAPQTPGERKRVQSLDATGLGTPLGPSAHHKKVNSMNSFQSDNSMVGSQHDEESTARHALRRFESPSTEPKIMTPTTSKSVVESLVTNVAAKQLDLPNLMKEEIAEGDEQEGTDKSEEDFNETDSDEDVKETPSKEELGAAERKQSHQKKRTSLPKPSKMSTLSSSGVQKKEAGIKLSKTGDTRREVLTAIMMKGLSGSHVIAEQAATGAQRHLQDLERRVAVEALLTADSDVGSDDKKTSNEDNKRQELLSLGIRSASSDELDELPKSEDDETLEAIRLMLIQYRVAKGSISANDAAAALAPHSRRSLRSNGKNTMMHFGKEFPEIDAGDIDGRLVGCGVLPPAVLQALTLWKGGMITNGELLELVKKDLEFEKYTQDVEQKTDKLNEDSAFWGRFAFGERWAEKRSRLAALSPDSNRPGWDLSGIIVKSNDDLRQESFIMQLIELCHEAFQEAELELWLLPYRIISTGRTTGIIEMVRNAMSFDALKKRPGYGAGGLREHLQRMTKYEANPSEAFKFAQRNFVRSLASYSLLSYLFLFKDRHNGNLLLDTAGHVIHIDFGFVFGVAPGGSFSLEMSTPFKLTDEMIEVMDGLRSSLFSEFVTLFCCGFLALQAHCDTFMTLVEVTSRGSTFKCFEGRDTAEIVGKLQERFRPELGKEDTIAHVLDIIKEAIGSFGTSQYDYFQYISQGIAM